MITKLKQVISKIGEMKDEEQLQIAKMLSDEINWDRTLQNSEDELSSLAQEAVTEYKNNRTQQTDW